MENLEGFIDELIHPKQSKKGMVAAGEEEIIFAEEVNNVEAVPYFTDESVFPNDEFDSKSVFYSYEFKKAVERELLENGRIVSIDNEVDSNRIMIQDLKSSVVSLKVSTSRIERDVKELTDNVGRFNTEKKELDDSLIDLEFRFNELVTDQESEEKVVIQPPVSSNDVDKNNCDFDDLQIQIKTVIDNLENKVQQMDEKITTIDAQNSMVKKLSRDIEKHEQMVQNIRKMLAIQERELSEMTELKEFPSTNNRCKHNCSSDNSADVLQKKVLEFIAKTEVNERSIATAWVGLIAALLLIPIAYFMGKFF